MVYVLRSHRVVLARCFPGGSLHSPLFSSFLTRRHPYGHARDALNDIDCTVLVRASIWWHDYRYCITDVWWRGSSNRAFCAVYRNNKRIAKRNCCWETQHSANTYMNLASWVRHPAIYFVLLSSSYPCISVFAKSQLRGRFIEHNGQHVSFSTIFKTSASNRHGVSRFFSPNSSSLQIYLVLYMPAWLNSALIATSTFHGVMNSKSRKND